MQRLDSPFTAPLMWLAGLAALVAICLVALQSETLVPDETGSFVSAADTQASVAPTAQLELRVEPVQDGWRIINIGTHGWADCLAEIGAASGNSRVDCC